MSRLSGLTLSVLFGVAAACSRSDNNAQPPGQPAAEHTPAPAPAPAPTPAASAAPDDGYSAESLGALTFALSEGTPAARAHFARGLLALHSFWYDEATRQFQAAITADPTMRMAYWGAAMSQFKLLWGDDDITAAKKFLGSMPDPEGLSSRDADWVNATLELLREGDVRSSRARFAAAMKGVHDEFPDDESATFLSIALLSTTRPQDPDNQAVRLRAAELALDVFKHNPKHPGAAHYLIHAYDTPALAERALPMARQYAQIAPGAFHARHMPSHIFSRFGMWKEAIASCQAAWDVSVTAAKRERLSADHYDFHSLNWLIEMQFEIGRRKDADAALEMFAKTVRDGLGHQMRGMYATQVASYMKRTGDWARADELLAPLSAAAVENEHEPAMGRPNGAPASHCAPPSASPSAVFEELAILDARARAAAALHDQAKTKQLIAELDALQVKLRPVLEATQPKDAAAKILSNLTRRNRMLAAEGANDDQALLRLLRESSGEADQEEANGESLHSGFLVHEEIADALLRLGRAKEAAAEYAHVLEQHPKRAHALLGAARAATRAHDTRVAHDRYHELAELWANADPNTDGLAEATAAAK